MESLQPIFHHHYQSEQSGERGESPHAPLKRTRAKRSCDFCRKRKSRCDADISTPCSNCKAWGYNCEFQTVRKKRGPPSVYVENLEKKCKKMESLLSALTNRPIKELEASNFRYAGHVHSFTPNDSESSEDDEEPVYESLHKEKYGCMRYAGSSSAGANLFDESIFQLNQTVPWPGRQDVELKMMSRNELAVVQTHRCSNTGKINTHIDVGLSMQGPSHSPNSHLSKPLICKKKPARHQLDKMIGLYFTHIHCILPIIHKKQFLERYHNMKTNESLCILMQAVLALTFRFAGQRLPDLVKDGEEFGEMYFKKVMRKLRDSDRSRLCYVQATLLMAIYLDMDAGDRESLEWNLVGSAIRMAQDLGLHRSCTNWDLPSSEIEVRHRVFYACYVLDRWLSTRLGKPLTIMDRGFDVDMPSPYELEDEGGGNSELPGDPSYRPFILMIKLCEILGRILKSLYAPNANLSNTNAGLDDFTVLTVLERRLQDWKNSLDEPFDGTYIADIDKYNLETHFYLVCILLYRPFTQISISAHPESKPVVNSSITSCTHAANSLIETFLKRNELCPVPSYHHLFCAPALLTYSLFQAALVHLSNALRERSSTNIQIYCRSICLIRGISSIGLAPRVSDSLVMLGVVNGLFEKDSEWLKNDFNPSMPLEAAQQIPSNTRNENDSHNNRNNNNNNNNSYNNGNNSYSNNNLPQHSYVQHRAMNTSVIGGITPDIQSDVGIVMDRPYSHQSQPFDCSNLNSNSSSNYSENLNISHNNISNHSNNNYNNLSNHSNNSYNNMSNNFNNSYNSNLRRSNYKHGQVQSNTNQSATHSHHNTHHRSISLDQLSSITPHIVSSHSRSASYDQFDFTMSTYQNTNRLIHQSYSSPSTTHHQQKPYLNQLNNHHSVSTNPYSDPLSQTTKNYVNTAEAYNTNTTMSNDAPNIGWGEWNVYLGHQQPSSSNSPSINSAHKNTHYNHS